MAKVLEVKDMHTSFFTYAGEVKAVRGVSFDVELGEAVGFVGESGCGKSVTMLSVMGILDEVGKVKAGEIIFNGKKLVGLSDRRMQKIRGNEMTMIFQDPMTSLNPVYTIGNQMIEHQIRHKKISKSEATKKAVDMLKLVGLPYPEKRIKQYPHEFSGGMRQRAMIAMALVNNPKLLIADEPTTALDVTIQAQILEVMKNIRKELDTSIILITHDLGVVASICDRVNVMYGGKIVETASAIEVYHNPKHPYTWGLLKSVPNPKKSSKEKLIPIEGQPPDLLKPPVGCPFTPRCEYSMRICEKEMPPEFKLEGDHRVACWLMHEKAPKLSLSSTGKGGN